MGIDICGAWVQDPLDLSYGVFDYPLNLDRFRFDTHVDFQDVHTRSVLSFQGSVFKGELNLHRIHVEESLFLRKGAKFRDVNCGGARITGWVDMTGATVKGTLNMNGMTVGQDLFMRGRASFQDVDLRGSRIVGQVDMTCAAIDGTMDLDGLKVGDSLFLRGRAYFKKSVQLTYSIIEKTVQLQGSEFHSVNLQGTKVNGELILGPPAITWKPEVEPDVVRLDLNAARVGVLRDSEESWPEKVELDGFVYDRWGGYSGEDLGGFHTRPVKWFKDWLKKEQPFRPQPYEQLAKVLRESGQPEKASWIMHAAKDRELCHSIKERNYFRALWFLFLKVAVGYGYLPRKAVLWAVLFIVLGVGMLEWTGQCSGYSLLDKFWYSLDTLIPFVKLNEKHYQELLCDTALNYFYIHQLAGYVLVTALIAGVTGLLKK